jgi:hypothetical protein
MLVIMDALIVYAVAMLARIVVEFFGALSATAFGGSFLSITQPAVPTLGVKAFSTPYGGVFDVGAAVMLVVAVGLEWGLAVARRRS